MEVFEFLNLAWFQWLNPQFYIDHGGLWFILFIVFSETGLFIGFFLPRCLTFCQRNLRAQPY